MLIFADHPEFEFFICFLSILFFFIREPGHDDIEDVFIAFKSPRLQSGVVQVTFVMQIKLAYFFNLELRLFDAVRSHFSFSYLVVSKELG